MRRDLLSFCVPARPRGKIDPRWGSPPSRNSPATEAKEFLKVFSPFGILTNVVVVVVVVAGHSPPALAFRRPEKSHSPPYLEGYSRHCCSLSLSGEHSLDAKGGEGTVGVVCLAPRKNSCVPPFFCCACPSSSRFVPLLTTTTPPTTLPFRRSYFISVFVLPPAAHRRNWIWRPLSGAKRTTASEQGGLPQLDG